MRLREEGDSEIRDTIKCDLSSRTLDNSVKSQI